MLLLVIYGQKNLAYNKQIFLTKRCAVAKNIQVLKTILIYSNYLKFTTSL